AGGFDLFLHTDARPGSGLGSSSSLMVTVIGLMKEWLRLTLDDSATAEMAWKLERQELGIPGGMQDQYAASYGGWNFIEFGQRQQVLVNPLRLPADTRTELEHNLVLCFTGATRISDNIVADQTARFERGDHISLDSLRRQKQLALEMKNLLLSRRLDEFGALMHEAWQYKKRMSPQITNARIDALYKAARQAGALGGKLNGAGGGAGGRVRSPAGPGSLGLPGSAPAAGLLFRGAIYGGSGYADGNLELLAGLHGHALPLQLAPIGLQEDRDQLLPPALRRELEKMQQRRLDLERSVLYQCAPAPDFDTQLDVRLRIGRTAFETDTLPRGWDRKCNAMDEVWVPSHFNRESFIRGGVDAHRLRVMPEGLDTRRFRPGLTPLPLPERRGFNFLSIFDWIDRKGPDVLLRAFCHAFHKDDDVALILKVHKFDAPGADLEEFLVHYLERELHLRLDRIPTIVLLRGLLPASDMPRLYASADAFVLASRGEGWGRPYMEAAASQLPVLATRWSGQLDFL